VSGLEGQWFPMRHTTALAWRALREVHVTGGTARAAEKGQKPNTHFMILMARLKPCPCYKALSKEFSGSQ
jgi:hypothetical protein